MAERKLMIEVSGVLLFDSSAPDIQKRKRKMRLCLNQKFLHEYILPGKTGHFKTIFHYNAKTHLLQREYVM